MSKEQMKYQEEDLRFKLQDLLEAVLFKNLL